MYPKYMKKKQTYNETSMHDWLQQERYASRWMVLLPRLVSNKIKRVAGA